MARESVKHPYTSSASAITQMIGHLRRAFPLQLSSETLKKLAIAPNNESHVLNVLRFLQVVDNDGNKIDDAAKVFYGADEDFQEGFADLVSRAYSDLFSHYGDDTWSLNTDKLISFFRRSDHTSDIVGRRQTTTFQTLALLAGKLDAVPTSRASNAKGDRPASTKTQSRAKPTAAARKPTQPAATGTAQANAGVVATNGNGDMALTVRIEINLPAGGDQETYDNIFKSIRENLLNAKPA